jgi:RNA ligase (TIGR02306 family)
MRKLVTVRKIDQILPIKDADAIEELVIGGWSVVAQKGLHQAGKDIVYFEIDSFLPESDVRFESFMKFGVSAFDGVKGHRVKTKRLRGVYSQGIVIPLAEFLEITNPEYDVDYSELVGVVKYEKQEVSGYTGDAKGTFPWFLRKSDQDRIQNVYNKLSNSDLVDKDFIGTLKMDGSSITVFAVDKNKYAPESEDVVGVDIAIGYCSRNQQLKMPEQHEGDWFSASGKFYQGAANSKLFGIAANICAETGMNVALQGELVGAGIQGNFEKFDTYQVFVYNISNVDTGEFLPYNEFKKLADEYEIQIVPEVYPAQKILQQSVGEIVKMADGKGLLASYREGVVWKQVAGNRQFKAISNKYLDKEV